MFSAVFGYMEVSVRLCRQGTYVFMHRRYEAFSCNTLWSMCEMKRSIRILSWWMLNGKLFYSWSCYWLWFMIRIGGNKWKCMHSPCIVIFWEHSSVLAWRIPGTGEPGELPPMGSHRVGHDWSDLAAAVSFLPFTNFILKTVYSFSRAWSSLFILFQGHLLFIFPW